MMKSEPLPVTILMAEDDDGHATLIEHNLRDAGLSNPMLRFRDGQELIEFIRGPGVPRGESCLILLDIRMPRMDGIEVLRILKTDPRLKTLPIVMLTTTDDPREVAECYALGCNWYVTKPVDFARFVETLRRLGFFLQVVKLTPLPA